MAASPWQRGSISQFWPSKKQMGHEVEAWKVSLWVSKDRHAKAKLGLPCDLWGALAVEQKDSRKRRGESKKFL